MTETSELNSNYKLESLGILPDYCLQEIFSRDFSNADTARTAILLSEETREKILSNLNIVRAEQVSSIINKYKSGVLEINSTSFEKTCECLMDRVQDLKEQGVVNIPAIGIDDTFLSLNDDLQSCSDSLPSFNMHFMDLHDLISWWDLAGKKVKSVFGKRIQVENIILERLADDFSMEVFAHSIDDISNSRLIETAKKLRENKVDDSRKRLDMSESFLLSLTAENSNRQFVEELAFHFHDKEEFKNKLVRLGPLLLIPSLKENLPLEDFAMSLYKLKHIHSEMGPEEMLKFTAKVDDHFFRRGLAVVMSGMDLNYVRKIISERKKAQLDETEIKLKMICDAVLCIRNRVSSYIMLELMSSYTVYDFVE